jgi:hypothetical protein
VLAWRLCRKPYADLNGEGHERAFGDACGQERRTPILRVPSVIVPEDSNVLVNPGHPTAAGVRIVAQRRFAFDRRVVKSMGFAIKSKRWVASRRPGGGDEGSSVLPFSENPSVTMLRRRSAGRNTGPATEMEILGVWRISSARPAPASPAAVASPAHSEWPE